MLLTPIQGEIDGVGTVGGTAGLPNQIFAVISGFGDLSGSNAQDVALLAEIDGLGQLSGDGTIPATSALVASIDGFGSLSGTLSELISVAFETVQPVTSCDGTLELGSASGILGLTSADGRLLLRDQE